MSIKPLFDNVLLKQIPATNTSKIVLPNEADERPDLATVIAVGSGGKVFGEEITMQVSVGDIVLFNKYTAHEFTHNAEVYILIKQTDILAVITQGEK